MYDVIIIGGGPAGFFSAILAKKNNPQAKILLLEKSKKILTKLSLSGGKRCNLSHAIFDPRELAKKYPRGSKELIGAFSRFQVEDTIKWFEGIGVKLKIEEDGKIFPASDRAETIVDALLSQSQNIELKTEQEVLNMTKNGEIFQVFLASKEMFCSKKLILATGDSVQGYSFAKSFGHIIICPVPSLFSFVIRDFDPFQSLSGISVDKVKATIFDFSEKGSILFTHQGFSGPVILNLSSLAAKALYENHYKAKLSIHWLYEFFTKKEEVFSFLLQCKQNHPNQNLDQLKIKNFSQNFWKIFLETRKNLELSKRKVSEISHQMLFYLAESLVQDCFQVEGRSEKFMVTSGGVKLDEIDCKTMESKKVPGLFFAGEILDIDGPTGGFNLQNVWTTGFMAGSFSLRKENS